MTTAALGIASVEPPGAPGPAAAAVLALAAVAAAWPATGGRARQRRVLGTGHPAGPVPSGRRARRPRRPPRGGAPRAGGPGLGLARGAGSGPAAPVAVVTLAAVAAAVAGGPVAAGTAGAYGAAAAWALRRHRRCRRHAGRRAAVLDGLAAAAADLRAGLPADHALAEVLPAGHGPGGAASPPAAVSGRERDPIAGLAGRTAAAVRLADRTGAPLAEVVERLEADARAADRARAATAAQVAGARATAWLLAALPAAGLALGYAVGAAPLPVLLHTPVGAACASGAVVLQLAGLAWAARITRPAGAGAAP